MLCCAALFAALALQFVLPSASSLPETSDLAPRRAPLPAAMANLNYPVILARPVFAPDRKPVATATASVGFEGYQVLGIGIAGAEKATVSLRGPDGKVQRVLFGDEFLGWKLTSVDRTQVVFERDGQRRVLVLEAPGAPGAAAAPGTQQQAQHMAAQPRVPHTGPTRAPSEASAVGGSDDDDADDTTETDDESDE